MKVMARCHSRTRCTTCIAQRCLWTMRRPDFDRPRSWRSKRCHPCSMHQPYLAKWMEGYFYPMNRSPAEFPNLVRNQIRPPKTGAENQNHRGNQKIMPGTSAEPLSRGEVQRLCTKWRSPVSYQSGTRRAAAFPTGLSSIGPQTASHASKPKSPKR